MSTKLHRPSGGLLNTPQKTKIEHLEEIEEIFNCIGKSIANRISYKDEAKRIRMACVLLSLIREDLEQIEELLEKCI